MQNIQTIDVGRDFATCPGGRYRRNGPHSAQEFREKFLIPALAANEVVEVALDTAEGYPASFLEESFGGLVRAGFSEQDLRTKLRLMGSDEFSTFVDAAWMYVHEADVRRKSHRGAA
jgi:STAS-like domain of unknown function (DUF4325)